LLSNSLPYILLFDVTWVMHRTFNIRLDVMGRRGANVKQVRCSSGSGSSGRCWQIDLEVRHSWHVIDWQADRWSRGTLLIILPAVR
jgi:hypothetical protein